MGSRKRSWKGRTRKMDMRSLKGRRSRSCSVMCSLLPVSLRIFFARAARMVGAYVSGTVKVIRTQTIPARMS